MIFTILEKSREISVWSISEYSTCLQQHYHCWHSLAQDIWTIFQRHISWTYSPAGALTSHIQQRMWQITPLMRVLKAEINFSWGRTQLKYDLRPADWGQQNIEWRRKTETLFSSSSDQQRSLQSGPGSRPAVALEGRKLGLWSRVSSPGKDQSGWTMQCPPNTDLFEKIDIKELMCCKVPMP